jgi:lysophospholipase
MILQSSSSQWFSRSLALCLSLGFGTALTIAPRQHPTVNSTATTLYAPRAIACPTTPLVRAANGLSEAEKSYVERRKRKADKALAAWLRGFDEKFSTKSLPTVAFVSSGGGYRSMLLGAGVIQAFDDRDSDSATSGLYQAMTYHAGLSGGAWLLSSIAGNGQETVGNLKEELWYAGLQNNSLYPINTETSKEFPAIKADILAKNAVGFTPTITDVWGRFLAYQLLRGPDGGAAKQMSSLAQTPSFRSFSEPYPIITALSVDNIDGAICDPPNNATQYEFTPYEFGSWVSTKRNMILYSIG